MRELLLRCLLMVLSVLVAAPAAAESTAVIVECATKDDFVAVHYVAADGAQDRALSQLPGAERIDPWTLVEVKDDQIVDQHSATKECTLSDGTYTITIGATPGNYNVQGGCGGHMSASANIYKDKHIIAGTEFEAGNCWDTETPVRTRVLWRVGAKEAEITETPYDDFV